MVSRRNFLTITIIMFVILFMFQFPEAVKDKFNHYDENEYGKTAKTDCTSENVYVASRKDTDETGRYAVYIGDCQDQSVGTVVELWAFYTKRYLESYASLQQYDMRTDSLPEVLVLDSAYMDWSSDTERLVELTEEGVNIIFCNLPESSVIAGNDQLRRLLGISRIREPVAVEGIHLFQGLLLGGEKLYIAEDEASEKNQDLELQMPWYQLSSGTKSYMVGMLDEEEVKNEEMPAIIWRSSVGTASVFAVNGSYLEDNSGIGILDGMMAEMSSYELYPIVNAQNLVMVNYPGLADENYVKMMELYSQSAEAVSRDIVWPGITSVLQKSNAELTCMMTSVINDQSGSQPQADLLIYYMKLMKELGAEAGLSSVHSEETEPSKKLDNNLVFLKENIPDYEIRCYYLEKMEDYQSLPEEVRTLYAAYDGLEAPVSYSAEDITLQRATNDGYSHTFSEDIRLNSMESALGYSSILVDLKQVIYPEGREDSWEKLFEKFSSNTLTYWNAYDIFEGTTLSESDKRIREFLALNYVRERKEDTVYLDIAEFKGEAWFILRTHGEEIVSAKGASWEKIEKDAYLIEASESQVQLELRETSQTFYYE